MSTYHKCDFCEPEDAKFSKHNPESGTLVIYVDHADIHICESCVDLCAEVVEQERMKRALNPVASSTEDASNLVSDKSQNTVHKDWITWNGGECPVSPDTVVEGEFRDGTIASNKAKSFDWTHDIKTPVDIIAYRVVEG